MLVAQEAITETEFLDTPARWVLAATSPVVYSDETTSSSMSNILGVELTAGDHIDSDDLV
jgi:hypothetical protein